MALIIIVGDLSVSLTISILFSRRLLLIESSSNNSQHTLLKRCLILSVFSIIILLFHVSLTIILGLVTLWTVLDVTMNSWCILLSFTEYNKIYWKVFGKLHSYIGQKCLLCYTCYCYTIFEPQCEHYTIDSERTITTKESQNSIEMTAISSNGNQGTITSFELRSNTSNTNKLTTTTASLTDTVDLQVALQDSLYFHL